MVRTLGMLAVAAASTLTGSWAFAFSCRPGLIPNGTVNNCSNCHVNPGGGGTRNAFGKSVELVAFGCDAFWGPDLAALDSDDDGRTNGEELQDPAGSWTPLAAPPGEASLVTNPGVEDAGGVEYIRGDSTADGAVDIADPVRTLGFLFLGDDPPTCRISGDANDDGVVDVSDAVYTLTFLFTGGPAPPAPFPRCGEAPPGADCASYEPCT